MSASHLGDVESLKKGAGDEATTRAGSGTFTTTPNPVQSTFKPSVDSSVDSNALPQKSAADTSACQTPSENKDFSDACNGGVIPTQGSPKPSSHDSLAAASTDPISASSNNAHRNPAKDVLKSTLTNSKVGKPKSKSYKSSNTGQSSTYSPYSQMKKTSLTGGCPSTGTSKPHQEAYYGSRHYGASYGSADMTDSCSLNQNSNYNSNHYVSGSTVSSSYSRGGHLHAAKPSAHKAPLSPNRTFQPQPSNFGGDSTLLHTLQSTWCLWLMVDRQSTDVAWKDKMREAHEFYTVEGFWSMHHNIHGPTTLGLGDYYLFRKGITPDWNDRVFLNGGGRLVIQLPSKHRFLDGIWLTANLLLIGEGYDFSDECISVCGAVAACRAKLTKIALWVATADPTKLVDIGTRFFKHTENELDLKLDLKPEFESFKKGTPLDVLFQPLPEKDKEKTVLSWVDLQRNYTANCVT